MLRDKLDLPDKAKLALDNQDRLDLVPKDRPD